MLYDLHTHHKVFQTNVLGIFNSLTNALCGYREQFGVDKIFFKVMAMLLLIFGPNLINLVLTDVKP